MTQNGHYIFHFFFLSLFLSLLFVLSLFLCVGAYVADDAEDSDFGWYRMAKFQGFLFSAEEVTTNIYGLGKPFYGRYELLQCVFAEYWKILDALWGFRCSIET